MLHVVLTYLVPLLVSSSEYMQHGQWPLPTGMLVTLSVTNPSTSRPLFGRIPPLFNLIPPSNPLFASSTQPLWLLGCPQTSYTHTKTEVKCELGIKVEDEGEDRDNEGLVIMVQPGPSV
jgi:hypothetical protein